MENLHLHLEYLLRRHDCVTVPGLGAFIATCSPARFDIEAGRIFPPYREISFNGALRHDDGLLASSYARRENISFEEGRVMASRAAERIAVLLHRERSIAVGNIGQLTLGEEDRITFVPRHTAEEWSRMLGMETLKLMAPATAAGRGDTISDEVGFSENNTSENVPAKKGRRPGRGSDRYYTFRIRKGLAHGVAAVMLVALVAISVFIPANHSEHPQEYASVVPVESIIRKAPATPAHTVRIDSGESEEITDKREDGTDMKGVTSTMSNPSPAVTVEDTEGSYDYYLIVATFRTRDEAENFIARHKDSHRTLECVAGKKLYRVAAGSSDNREELQKKLNDKSLTAEFEGAWIWKR